ncbi:TetR family transcriptional regulator [Patulibacter minatonensis]|uniref:TetR family transcriptional regulator n=1 Tax=Patulibacter minatonensis TaxID=298163 RepID=UPI00047DCEEE|nr:TetR family transcriptional regulator [Patulibacter minatonensis]
MPRDASATRARILDAAVAEFSALGLAGARIDRIAEAASANKRLIYVHFGSKDGLFDAALDTVLSTMSAAVPLTEDDLPGYAARMFDYLLVRPEAARISSWRKLERPGSSPDFGPLFTSKVAAMSAGHGGGSGFDPVDLVVFVTTLGSAWFTVPDGLIGADGRDPRDPERLAAHRAAIVEAVRRLVAR